MIIKTTASSKQNSKSLVETTQHKYHKTLTFVENKIKMWFDQYAVRRCYDPIYIRIISDRVVAWK